MKKYILKRFLQLIPVLIGITFLSFAMMRIAGSDAITELYGDKGAVAQEIIDAKRAELGLDQPFLTQYLAWVGGILTGDMGISYISGRDVFQTFVSKLPATLLLTVLAICATVIISIPLGVLAAVRHDKFTDYFLRFFSFIGNSLPNFFVALLLMQVFSIHWSIFPVISNGTTVQSAVLPTLTLAVAMSAKYMRQGGAEQGLCGGRKSARCARTGDSLEKCSEILHADNYYAAGAVHRKSSRRHGDH